MFKLISVMRESKINSIKPKSQTSLVSHVPANQPVAPLSSATEP